jgi:hypothetical protein
MEDVCTTGMEIEYPHEETSNFNYHAANHIFDN